MACFYDIQVQQLFENTSLRKSRKQSAKPAIFNTYKNNALWTFATKYTISQKF